MPVRFPTITDVDDLRTLAKRRFKTRGGCR